MRRCRTIKIIFYEFNKNQVELVLRRMVLLITISSCAGVAQQMLNIFDEIGYVRVALRFLKFGFNFNLSRCSVEFVSNLLKLDGVCLNLAFSFNLSCGSPWKLWKTSYAMYHMFCWCKAGLWNKFEVLISRDSRRSNQS